MSVYDNNAPISKSLGMMKMEDITVEMITDYLEEISHDLKKNAISFDKPATSKYDYIPLKKAANSCLKVYLQLLGQTEDIIENNPDIEEFDVMTGPCDEEIEGFPVRVEFNEKYKALIIDTTVIFKAYRNLRYNECGKDILHSAVNAALIKYNKKIGGKITDLIAPPYCIYFLRRVLKGSGPRSVPDHDNIPVKDIINAICQSVNLSDTYRNMVWLKSGCELVEDKEKRGTTFVIIEEKNCLKFEEDFIKNGHTFERIE